MRAAPSQVVGSHPSMGPSPAASEGPKFHAVGSTDMDFIYAFMAVTAFWMGPVLGPLVGNFFFLVAATVLAGNGNGRLYRLVTVVGGIAPVVLHRRALRTDVDRQSDRLSLADRLAHKRR